MISISVGTALCPTALPEAVNCIRYSRINRRWRLDKFKNAGIGRGNEYLKNEFVRTDAISWITGESERWQGLA